MLSKHAKKNAVGVKYVWGSNIVGRLSCDAIAHTMENIVVTIISTAMKVSILVFFELVSD